MKSTHTLFVDAFSRTTFQGHSRMPEKPGNGEALRPLDSVVTDLAIRTVALSKLDLHLTEQLKSIEEALRTHMTTRVSTVLRSWDDVSGNYQELLVFGKWDNRWQLLIESNDIEDAQVFKTTPLMSAPREVRTRVLIDGHVERLIRDAITQLDAQIREREDAVRIANTLNAALSPRRAKP